MEERQLFRDVTVATTAIPTAMPTATADVSSYLGSCDYQYVLPAGGVLSLFNGDVVTLTAAAVFKPTCTPVTPPIIANGGTQLTVDQTAGEENTVTNLPTRDPFYASTFPQCYALAATTVIAYTLVIMLLITPRSFLDGGIVVLGRRGFTSGGTGGHNIGGRPWLQKVAALTVAISLTIATANTFRVAEGQYSDGYSNAEQIQAEVLGGTELKIIRIISGTFLWLAQAQTLIRLFPRQREKVIIKWTAFALVTLDLIFQCLNSFLYTTNGNTRPRSFTEAVPALSYLFELSLGVLYAAWVLYYSLMKKQYSFYHQRMKNMCLVAILSIMSILVPVVFFIMDISKPEFIGWGDYVRWVGAAAASVVVWEWVERIEALEREEKKDGILGREVFDGDEMMDTMPSDYTWPRRRKGNGNDSEGGDRGSRTRAQGFSSGRGNIWSATMTQDRSRSRPGDDQTGERGNTESSNHDRIRFLQPPLWPSRPAPAVTPISRTDSASAASTDYAVRYHPLTETTSRTTPRPRGQTWLSRSSSPAPTDASSGGRSAGQVADPAPDQDTSGSRWRALAQGIPFPRVGRNGSSGDGKPQPRKQVQHEDTGRWDIRARLEEFAVSQAEKIREKIRPSVNTDSLPVTVVPAPPRRGAALAQLLEDEELELQPTTATPTTAQFPHMGTQRRSSGASWSSPTAVEPSRQGSDSAYTRPRPGRSRRPTLETARNTPLSITIVPAPARGVAVSGQAQSSVLGRQVTDGESRD